MSYAEIRQFKLGKKQNIKFPKQEKTVTYIPLLSELIDSVEAYIAYKNMPAPYYNIEIKSTAKGDNTAHPAPEEFVELVMQQLVKKGITDRVIIQSFDMRPLQIMNKNYPKVRLSYLTENLEDIEGQLADLGFKPYAISPYYEYVNKQTIKMCHRAGVKIIPWTVNNKQDIDRLVYSGVDGIITDYPNLLFNNR